MGLIMRTIVDARISSSTEARFVKRKIRSTRVKYYLLVHRNHRLVQQAHHSTFLQAVIQKITRQRLQLFSRANAEATQGCALVLHILQGNRCCKVVWNGPCRRQEEAREGSASDIVSLRFFVQKSTPHLQSMIVMRADADKTFPHCYFRRQI